MRRAGVNYNNLIISSGKVNRINNIIIEIINRCKNVCVCVAAVSTIREGTGGINNGRLRASGRTDTHTTAHTARDTVGG